MAIRLSHQTMVHFKDTCMNKLCKHFNVLQERFIPHDLFQGIMGRTSNAQPSLPPFSLGWDGWVGTLMKCLATVPVVDIGCVKYDGLPSLNTLPAISVRRFSAPPQMSNNCLNPRLEFRAMFCLSFFCKFFLHRLCHMPHIKVMFDLRSLLFHMRTNLNMPIGSQFWYYHPLFLKMVKTTFETLQLHSIGILHFRHLN